MFLVIPGKRSDDQESQQEELKRMKDHNYYVYFLTNKNNTVLYIGVTNNLKRRIYEHKNKLIKGFTYRYNVEKLVYFEHFTDINQAIYREKQLKKWKREWKNKLVEENNLNWKDLYEEI